MAKQIVLNQDPLKNFKENAFSRYRTCSFFEHNVNQSIDIGIGESNGHLVREKIITDGRISLHRKNQYSPLVVWQNVLVSLENGLSINIDIRDATFMVDIISFGDKKEHEIHIIEEDRASLQTILNFLYHQQPIEQLSTISFKSPSILILESTLKGNIKQEILDLNTGKSKVKHNKRKGRI